MGSSLQDQNAHNAASKKDLIYIRVDPCWTLSNFVSMFLPLMNKDPLKAQKASFLSTWQCYLFWRLHITAGFREVLSITSAQWEHIPNFRGKPTLLIITREGFSTTCSCLRGPALKQTGIWHGIHKTGTTLAPWQQRTEYSSPGEWDILHPLELHHEPQQGNGAKLTQVWALTAHHPSWALPEGHPVRACNKSWFILSLCPALLQEPRQAPKAGLSSKGAQFVTLYRQYCISQLMKNTV